MEFEKDENFCSNCGKKMYSMKNLADNNSSSDVFDKKIEDNIKNIHKFMAFENARGRYTLK